MNKLAIKRLTASDLTLFEWHFRNRNAGNQKAINLNADVFVDVLFPALPELAGQSEGRFPVDLYILGPSMAPELNLQRKIIKGGAYKNWRLDGEIIHNPVESPNRFNELVEGDTAILEFNEGQAPHRVRVVMLARSSLHDQEFHASLDRLLGDRSMITVNQQVLSDAMQSVHLRQDHPAHELLLDADLDDAAQGGPEGTSRLLSRRSGRAISRSQLADARRRADEVGQLGEEFIDELLRNMQASGEIDAYAWEALENAVSPYDFRVSQGGRETLVEVKSTAGEFERPLHFSISELQVMADRDSYEVYRVYGIQEADARVRTARGLQPFARAVLEALRFLPEGVVPSSLSVRPERLPFGDEARLRLTS